MGSGDTLVPCTVHYSMRCSCKQAGREPAAGLAGRNTRLLAALLYGQKEKLQAAAYFPHPVARAVSSALRRFTSVFGMGTGGSASLQPPGAVSTVMAPAGWPRPACRRHNGGDCSWGWDSNP